ncbi:hypothetical protein COOONC_24175 [Cooperia oncophora]
MFAATGIADVTSLLSNVFLRLNRELGLGEEFRYFVLYLAFDSGVSFVAHMFGNMLLTINRYTAICMAQQYHTLWSRRNVWIVIGVQYFVSFACSAYMLTSKVVYIRNQDGTTVLKGMEGHVDVFIRCVYIGAGMIYATVGITLNVSMLVAWHKMSKQREFPRNGNQEKVRAL